MVLAFGFYVAVEEIKKKKSSEEDLFQIDETANNNSRVALGRVVSFGDSAADIGVSIGDVLSFDRASSYAVGDDNGEYLVVHKDGVICKHV